MKVLFVFAHPDDETFSSGGTIRKLVNSGAIVKLITATTGQAGQYGEVKVNSPEHLGEIRKKELEAASKVLGISEIFYLGLYDGELIKQKTTFLTQKILEIIEKEEPDIVVTFEKHGGSNHPDHKKISKAATSAFKEYIKKSKKYVKLYHTVSPRSYLKKYADIGLLNTGFGNPKGVSDKEITTFVDISDVYQDKDRAARCHITQAADWERFLKRAQHVNLKMEYFKLIEENSFFLIP